MAKIVPCDSQPLDEWVEKYTPGRFFDPEGRKTHSIETGSGEPVILIHGFNTDSYTWVTNIEAQAERRKIFAVDLWGFGFSTREPQDYGYKLFAEQILLFMEALSIERASLYRGSNGLRDSDSV
jgi:pimeloyl-ACP methyl ester carboxylesterase